MRGITQLYAELMLLAVVVSVGGTLIYAAAGIENSLRNTRLPPKISAYRIGNTVIIANWGDTTYRIRVICLDNGTYEEVDALPGTYLYNTTCRELVVTYGDYAVNPVEVS